MRGINYEKNFKWAVQQRLISFKLAKAIENEGLEGFSGGTVVKEAYGRRVQRKVLLGNPEYNVKEIFQFPIFNKEGNYEVSVDTALLSGSTWIPSEIKTREFGWRKHPTALITADKWDKLIDCGGFLFVVYTDSWFLWDTLETDPLREVWLKVPRRKEDPNCKEKIKRRNYELRFSDALLSGKVVTE